MHKIAKGLKKKKKGKKSKHKEEELFKPEELEAYRKEHHAHQEGGGTTENEEWKKFLALTSGVDNVLQKTQEELSRIKETSFFQRVPPPSEVHHIEEKATEATNKVLPQVQETQETEAAQLGIVEISESETEGEEEEDDIFDTAYIDDLASGEVKLAYIPESPTEELGDDPFDTTYAEKAILGPGISRKGKKLVPIGSAVEVLTGRVQLPTCSTQNTVNRRQIFKERDLLLSSFDDNANSIAECLKDSPLIQKTLLDEDAPPELSEEPIDLSKNLYIPPSSLAASPLNEVLQDQDDPEDDEFAQLAAENLNKEQVNKIETLPSSTAVVSEVFESGWDVQADNTTEFAAEFDENIQSEADDIDPFDTAFAENILPGKAELKQIESEILNTPIEYQVKPEQEKLLHILKKLSISEDDSRDKPAESTLGLIQRDLLGGSNVDLPSLNQPLSPAAQIDENYIEYCDPFDTSNVDVLKKPGQTELKVLEKELLADLQINNFNDDDFDPRAGEVIEQQRERTVSRPDVLNILGTKSVCFDTSALKEKDYIQVGSNISKLSKPPTPFYVRKNSVPGATDEDNTSDIFETKDESTTNNQSNNLATNYQAIDSDTEEDFDPFDTSIANNIIIGTL